MLQITPNGTKDIGFKEERSQRSQRNQVSEYVARYNVTCLIWGRRFGKVFYVNFQTKKNWSTYDCYNNEPLRHDLERHLAKWKKLDFNDVDVLDEIEMEKHISEVTPKIRSKMITVSILSDDGEEGEEQTEKEESVSASESSQEEKEEKEEKNEKEELETETNSSSSSESADSTVLDIDPIQLVMCLPAEDLDVALKWHRGQEFAWPQTCETVTQ